ncbi:MAG TPA: HipA N-terminal domain-containing protein, partial [Candidatus Berkiella sp.]|nr:HipA N-terminal domain-containing protein [Candidatus Berkiella sp.]
MLLNKLSVYLYDHLIGYLECDRNNKMTFSYCTDAIFALSLSMPLKDKTFDDKNCRKYFRGILPEDGVFLEALCQSIGTHPKDTFGLLKTYGKECIGAISFW